MNSFKRCQCENCGSSSNEVTEITYLMPPFDTIFLCIDCSYIPHENIQRRDKLAWKKFEKKLAWNS